MYEAHPIRARRRERGEVTWVGLVLLLGFAAAAYLAYAWIPVYVRMQQVDEIVRSTANSAVKDSDDAALVNELVRRVRALDTVEVLAPSGEQVRAPAIDLAPQDVTWERNPQARTLRIAFSYTVEAVYPWIGRTHPHPVDVDHVGDLSIPDWGKK